MAEIRVRKLEDWVVAALRVQAKQHGNSLEAQLREWLRKEAMRPRIEAAQRADALRQAIAQDHGNLPDSAVHIREDRDTRG